MPDLNGGSKSMSIYSYTFSWNAPGHSIQKSILFLSVEIQNEIRVNLINESRWHLLKSFCSGAAEVDATAPLPPSNKYMDNCWPRLLDTLTSCLNNCGGTQLRQLLLLLLAVRQLLPKWGRVIKPNPPAIAARMAPRSGPAPLGRRFKDRRGEVVTLTGGHVVRAGNPPRVPKQKTAQSNACNFWQR